MCFPCCVGHFGLSWWLSGKESVWQCRRLQFLGCLTVVRWRRVGYIIISRGSSWPRDWTCVSCISGIGRWILHHWATWDAQSLQLYPTLRPHGLQPTRLLCPWDFPGKNTGVGWHFLLQGHLENHAQLLFLYFEFLKLIYLF